MYNIKLPNFEGPFDLLLYFIKRDELNIYDIPIARVTEEFLHYIRVIQQFDLEVAGEFLVMAANLMVIKAQMLLPQNQDEEDGSFEDPRRELVRKLLEYVQYKEASKELSVMADEAKYILYRKMYETDNALAKQSGAEQYARASVFDLIGALGKVLDRLKNDRIQHVVPIATLTVEERSEWLVKTLQSRKRLIFSELISNESKMVIVVTFLSILDLIKKNLVWAIQSEVFDDIILTQPEYNLN